MNNGFARRLLAGLMLGTVATSMAACGPRTLPLMSPGSSLANTFAVKPQTTDDYVFNLKFDAKRAPTRYVAPHAIRGIAAAGSVRDQMSPVQNQGKVGSCTGFAAEGIAEYWARKAGTTEQLSPGFIYLKELEADGNLGYDAGSYISTAVDVLSTFGTCPETLHPYISAADQLDDAKKEAYLSTLPSAAALAAAKPNRIKAAKQINDLDGFKTAIAAGKPVIFGITCYESIKYPEVKQTGMVPMPKPNEKRLGGHAIVAVGYDDKTQLICFRNSWSTAWGDKGYGYLPYDYFKGSLVHDAWAAN